MASPASGTLWVWRGTPVQGRGLPMPDRLLPERPSCSARALLLPLLLLRVLALLLETPSRRVAPPGRSTSGGLGTPPPEGARELPSASQGSLLEAVAEETEAEEEAALFARAALEATPRPTPALSRRSRPPRRRRRPPPRRSLPPGKGRSSPSPTGTRASPLPPRARGCCCTLPRVEGSTAGTCGAAGTKVEGVGAA